MPYKKICDQWWSNSGVVSWNHYSGKLVSIFARSRTRTNQSLHIEKYQAQSRFIVWRTELKTSFVLFRTNQLSTPQSICITLHYILHILNLTVTGQNHNFYSKKSGFKLNMLWQTTGLIGWYSFYNFRKI